MVYLQNFYVVAGRMRLDGPHVQIRLAFVVGTAGIWLAWPWRPLGTPANLIGGVSLIFWGLSVIVSFKYVTLVLTGYSARRSSMAAA